MKALLLSDIHGNWAALQAVLRAEPDATQIICLGDLVNYGPQPVECVVWAMQLTAPNLVIQGNEDRAFGLGTAPGCAPTYRRLAKAVQAATSRLLTSEMRRFLATLQPSQRFCFGDATCVAGHCSAKTQEPLGSRPGTPNAVWPWESDIILVGHPDKLFVVAEHPDLLFLAHTHNPLKIGWLNTLVVNPGSVGKPMDGDPRAAYAVWEDGMVSLRRIAYDIEETLRGFGSLALEECLRRQLCEELRAGARLPQYAPVEMAV